MRVLLAGATGVVGRLLVERLVADGHEVVGTTRSAHRVPDLERLGCRGVVMDGLDPASVDEVVRRARPEVVVHQMTALSAMAGDLRHLDDEFAATNRLRVEATDHLLAAAREHGAGRVVVQSYTGWPTERSGPPVRDETARLDPRPPSSAVRTVAAMRHVDTVVPETRGVEGLVLRFGTFYGPGTALALDGAMTERIAARRFPVVGSGQGRFSFCHVEDAASATVAALMRGAPGVYNVCDDEPAPVAEWVPFVAELVGARPPLRVPVPVARLVAGELAVAMMTQARGASNAKAKSAFGWTPSRPDWREGLRRELAPS